MRNIRRRTLGPLAFCAALMAASLVPATASARDNDDDGFLSGMVFTSSNAVDGNQLLCMRAVAMAR